MMCLLEPQIPYRPMNPGKSWALHGYASAKVVQKEKKKGI